MNIRSFTDRDIKRIVSLANSCATFDSDVSEVDFQPAWSFPRGLLVADDDGEEVVGFVFAYLREVPSELLNRWGASKVAQIELLVVDSLWRGQGIGRALLEKLLDVFREEGVDLVLLHCPAEAIEAKHLYDKLGFEMLAYAMKKRL